MFDATKLPTEPCDPAKASEQPAPLAPQFVRAPEGHGHEAAVKQGGAR